MEFMGWFGQSKVIKQKEEKVQKCGCESLNKMQDGNKSRSQPVGSLYDYYIQTSTHYFIEF